MIPTTEKFITALRKGVHPYPVYEAHFTDGTVNRMSFWSPQGRALDVETGKYIATTTHSAVGKVFDFGMVEWDGARMSPVMAAAFVPFGASAKAPRASLARARAIFRRMEGGTITPAILAELKEALAA
ncbi:MAG: hypothetical protein GEU78_08060 [Actinobacteria bacterium]|nr:hypothetical protein [Actinomycetota bacterium]